MKTLLFSGMLVLLSFCSCTDKEDATPNQLDYYPTANDSKWVYIIKNNILLDNHVWGDTILDGKKYAVMGPNNTIYNSTLLVRKENGRYYGRGNNYGIYHCRNR
jgi:hypothetical protein